MKLQIAVVLFLVGSGAFADPWSGAAEIQMVYPVQGGIAFITSYKNPEISGCDGGARYMISSEHSNYAVMSSALLAAFMAEKKISFNIDNGQSGECSPTINRFHIYK